MKIYNNNDGSTGKISTSKGNQVKMCVNDIWYKTDYLGYEGASEYLCSTLLEQTNIKDFTRYKLETISINGNEYNGCSSKNFLKQNEEIITANKLFKSYYGQDVENIIKDSNTRTKIEKFVEYVEKVTEISDYGKNLTSTLEWDAFVLNEDRHYNNIAFIKNAQTNKYRCSPLFDNGAAFLSDTREDYPLEKSMYGLIASVTAKPFNKDFDEQVEACEKLYGKQLEVSSDISISEETITNIKNRYGDKVCTRICDIFAYQLNLCNNLVRPSEIER